jgi:hypothetical protein
LKHSIQSFLSEIIDYAGLYPPTSLSLDVAFDKYVKHTRSNQTWMLSKFVTGTNNLKALQELIRTSEQAPQPFLITAVAAPSASLDEFKQVVDNTKTMILDIVEGSTKEINVPSLEIKLPESFFKDSDISALDKAIEYTVDQMDTSDKLPHQVFFEICGFTFDNSYSDLLIEALQRHKIKLEHAAKSNYSFSAFKIRCGGVEAFQFPPTDYLAYSINSAAKSKVALKFTAGLHHPIRHYNDSVSTKMHGFLNVFGATLLSHSAGLNINEIQTMLEDENDDNFSFNDSHFSWKGHSISSEEIIKLRALYVTSFGSCSFEEPIEDLQKLNLLT